MKKSAITNIVIGLCVAALGVLALTGDMKLGLFGIIPIPNSLVIAIGVIWTIVGISGLFTKPPAVEPEEYPAVQPGQPYPQQGPPQENLGVPQYAPRDPEGPTPI